MLEDRRVDQFRAHVRKGFAAHERGDYPAAEREYLAACKIEPSLAEPRMAAALSAERQFHHLEAEAWLRGALIVAPWRDDARVMLVGVLLHEGKLGEAASLVQRLRVDRRTDERVLRQLEAALHFRAGRYDDAVAEFAQLLPDPIGLIGIGAVKAVAGDLAGAEDALAKARSAAPKSALPDYDLALVHYYSGRLDEAAEDAQSALKKDPLYLPAMTNLAAIYLRQGRIPDAEQVLRRALDVGRWGYAPAYANLGVLEYDRGSFDAAAQLLEQAVKLAPRVPANHYNLAMALYRLGRWERAVRELDETLKLAPRHQDALRNKRWIQDLLGGAKGGMDLPRPQATLLLGEYAS